jgi:hypothetical protein
MTADYYLLVVCPTYKDFQPGSLDRTPLRTQGSASNIFKSIQKSQSEEYQGPKEDALGGNWCDRTKKIAKQINDAIAEYDERRQGTNLQTVHHNNEFHNPFADELQNNMPCLVILPNEIDLGSISPDAGRSAIILIEKPEELIACRELLRKTGYYWPSHARYAAHPEFRLTRAISDGTLFSTTTPPAHLEVSKNVASLTSSSSPVFPRAQIRQL